SDTRLAVRSHQRCGAYFGTGTAFEGRRGDPVVSQGTVNWHELRLSHPRKVWRGGSSRFSTVSREAGPTVCEARMPCFSTILILPAQLKHSGDTFGSSAVSRNGGVNLLFWLSPFTGKHAMNGTPIQPLRSPWGSATTCSVRSRPGQNLSSITKMMR